MSNCGRKTILFALYTGEGRVQNVNFEGAAYKEDTLFQFVRRDDDGRERD